MTLNESDGGGESRMAGGLIFIYGKEEDRGYERE